MRVDHFAYQQATRVAGFGLLLQLIIGLTMSVFGSLLSLTGYISSQGDCSGALSFIEQPESALLAIRDLNGQAYILHAKKPLEVRFAENKQQNHHTGAAGGNSKSD